MVTSAPDSWKSCHALVIAVFEGTRDYKGAEKRLIGRLGYSAMRAAGRLAFGKGTRNRKMFVHATAQASGFLSQFQYYLSLVRVIEALPDELCSQLDALRGRASFYVGQLFESLLSGRGDRSNE